MTDIKKLLDEAFKFNESYKNRDKFASDLMVKTEFHFAEICKSLDVDYDKAKVLILLGHNLGWQHSAVYNHNRIAPLAKEIIVELVEAIRLERGYMYAQGIKDIELTKVLARVEARLRGMK
jgi:hypothetical protein